MKKTVKKLFSISAAVTDVNQLTLTW